MHPMRACARYEIVRPTFGRSNQRHAEFSDAILPRRGRLTMPVHGGRRAQTVIEINHKPLTRIEEHAACTVRLMKPENGGVFAVNLNRTPVDDEAPRGNRWL